MLSSHSKIRTNKDDSICNASQVSSTSNVNSLRKLFEGNFKLISNPFKSKHKNAGSVFHTEIESQSTNQVFTYGKSTKKYENLSSNSKENRCVADNNTSQQSKSDSTDGSYLNCNIPNCCCKTFFREYNNTPFRYRHVPKTPLKERNSEFNQIVTPKPSLDERLTRLKSLNGNLENQNKFYNINYQFYKPKNIESNYKSFENIAKSIPEQISKPQDLSTNYASKEYRPSNVIKKINHCCDEDSLNIDEKTDNEQVKLFNKSTNHDNHLKPDANDDDRKYISGGNFNLKYRMPKFKNIALRENSHPYTVKKQRLTVKSVKNRNMRNVKRRQQMLDRSQTFNGYDNFAYRRSITELSIPKNSIPIVESKPEPLTTPAPEAETVPVVKDASDKEPSNMFRADNRITSYNWPVTSFYIDSKTVNDGELMAKYSSTSNLNCKSDTKSTGNFITKKSNLKRHCSLGYLQDELYEYNFTRRRRSLDFTFNKASATCGIRNIPEVNNKIIVKQRKFQNLDIHAHALFAAVEHGYVEKTKSILESSEVDVNSVNSDGLSSLDVAVLSNNKPLVKVLVTYGAQEGRKFNSADDMRNHLYHLLHGAERRVQELGTSLRLNIESDGSSLSSSSSNIPSVTMGNSGSGGGSQNKTYSIWERRAKGLKRMLMGFEQIRPPDLPATVNVEVTSVSSLMVYFQESESKTSSVTTKFRVQWSTDKDFCSLCGHYEVSDTRQKKYHINNLLKGQSYYVRVASGNIKGYSSYKLSTPLFVVPSSWHDVTDKDIRFSSGMKETFDDILGYVVVQHPYLKSNVELYGQGGELLVNQQRRKKTTIKQLFTAASKFQKHLRRGVYLSCLLYHEDKVLVTNEDFLPVIEVDETYPKKIHDDFHWFFKVVFSGSDLKWLKTDMEKSQSPSALFRIKLLQAAVHMQTALSIQELGKLYYKLVRDAEGTIVISVINYIQSPKSVSVLNLRWLPLAKLSKRTNIIKVAESNVADILMSSIPDQITYHRDSSIKLPRGLYLSYLKMRSSVDSLQVLVPSRVPNIPPHCKIRDNPHVTAEEWEWLAKKQNLRESLTNGTHQQRLFIEQIADTARRLLSYMEVPEDDAANHRLYDAAVIEVSKDVSLIMVVPPIEAACAMPGQRKLLLQRSDLLPLTVQAFEMLHFGTYQLDLISTYSRLSCIIEMDMDLAQHSFRKAFSSSEVSSAKSKLNKLENLHTQLNTSWKRGRWLLDVISFARDRLSLSPTNLRYLLNVHPKRSFPSNKSHSICNHQIIKPLNHEGAGLKSESVVILEENRTK